MKQQQEEEEEEEQEEQQEVKKKEQTTTVYKVASCKQMQPEDSPKHRHIKKKETT